MHVERSIRPGAGNTGASRTIFTVIRIMIAAYFLASATTLVFDPMIRTPFDAIMRGDLAHTMAIFYLFGTGIAVMLGFFVRPAALLLAAFVFWSGFAQLSGSTSIEDLSDFWGEMALLGALLLVAAAEPGGSGRFSPWMGQVAPRRVDQPDRPKAARPRQTEATLTRDAILSGAAMRDDKDDGDNLFADLWERPAVKTL